MREVYGIVFETNKSINATSHSDLLIHVILGIVPSLSGERAKIARLHLAPLALIKRLVCILISRFKPDSAYQIGPSEKLSFTSTRLSNDALKALPLCSAALHYHARYDFAYHQGVSGVHYGSRQIRPQIRKLDRRAT